MLNGVFQLGFHAELRLSTIQSHTAVTIPPLFRAVLRGVNRRACSRTCICGVNRPPMHAVAVATTRGHFGLHVTFLRCPLDWHISKLSVPVIYISAANQKNRAYYVQARLQQPNMAACATMHGSMGKAVELGKLCVLSYGTWES